MVAALFAVILLGGCASRQDASRVTPAAQSESASFHAAPAPNGASGEQILYDFPGAIGGGNPATPLWANKHEDLYGTTDGGTYSTTIFELKRSGHGFSALGLYAGSQSLGSFAAGQLFVDKDGDLFGATTGGQGSCDRDCGLVFELQPLRGGGYYLIRAYRFGGLPDGGFPTGIIEGAGGTLYGTTSSGGEAGLGAVFKLTPTATGFSETILYSFRGGSDGARPVSPPILDAAGTLYGTTYGGGTGTTCSGGCGTVYSLASSASTYTESVLYSFQGGSDGAIATSSLVADRAGALYGTTSGGGTGSCMGGCGTAFKLTPTASGYTESFLYSFQGGADGSDPVGALVFGKKNRLYGVTELGGTASAGTLFELTPAGSGYTETVPHVFGIGADGAYPAAGLLESGDRLFGTTVAGGTQESGTVFEFTP